MEGIYALSDKLRPLQDLRVSISGGVHFDLVGTVQSHPIQLTHSVKPFYLSCETVLPIK